MRKSTGLFLAFVGAVGALAAWDLLSDKKAEEKKSEAAVLVPFLPDQVQTFSIQGKDQKIVLNKTIDGWKIISPFEDWADNVATDEFVTLLTKHKSLSVIDKVTKDLSVYGLKPAAGEITVTHQNQNSVTYFVGSERTVDQNSYLQKKDSSSVIVAAADWLTWLKKPANDFRDRRLVRSRMAAIEEVRIKNSQGTMTLKKKGNDWEMLGDSKIVLDQARVREMLNQLTLTKGEDILAEKNISAEQKLKYGFTSPQVHLDLKLADKTWSADFAQNKDQSVYVITSDPYFLMRMEENVFTRLKYMKKSFFKNRTDLFYFSSEMVHQIDLKTALKNQSLILRDSGWVLDKGDSQKALPPEKVLALLSTLKKTTLADFADGVSVFKGTDQLSLKDENGTLLYSLSWGEFKKVKIEDKEKNVALARSSVSPDLFYIEAGEIEKLDLNSLLLTK